MFAELFRGALAGEHPLRLLSFASIIMRMGTPDPIAQLRGNSEPLDMDRVISNFAGAPSRRCTAVLAALAELMVDEPERQSRCRREVLARNDSLPESISNLSQIRVHRAARVTHVLGDEDQILVGAEIAGGYNITCLVHFDHNTFSEIDNAYVVPAAIDDVLADAIAKNANPDVSSVEMSLADARAWIQHGIEMPFATKSDTWPDCRALVKWLIAHLPEGGAEYQSPEWDWKSQMTLVRGFFASPQGAPFNSFRSEGLLLELIESGTGDAAHWSAARIARLMSGSPLHGEHITLYDALAVPALLRAFIPFAHAQSGIREELTAEALAAVDELSPAYKQAVLDKADYWE